MGPGLLIKSLLQGSFSLMVFGWTQVLMDVQPLVVMLRGEGHMHGFTHTYVGATLVAIVAAVSGKYCSEFGFKFLQLDFPSGAKIKWWVCFLSAYIGSYTHVFLDSIMHSDIQPFYPFSLMNGLHHYISVWALHKLCMFSGVIGALIYGVVYLRHRALR
jgi:membrane-bound metal-dependent hydrolase YbcI (DUF457 family)